MGCLLIKCACIVLSFMSVMQAGEMCYGDFYEKQMNKIVEDVLGSEGVPKSVIQGCVVPYVFDYKDQWGCINIMNGHSEGVFAVDFSRDGSKIASLSWDNTICMWDIQTGERLESDALDFKDEVRSIHFDFNPPHVFPGGLKKVCDALQKVPRKSFLDTQQWYVGGQNVRITYSQGALGVCNRKETFCLLRGEIARNVNVVRLFSKKKQLALGYRDGIVRLCGVSRWLTFADSTEVSAALESIGNHVTKLQQENKKEQLSRLYSYVCCNKKKQRTLLQRQKKREELIHDLRRYCVQLEWQRSELMLGKKER